MVTNVKLASNLLQFFLGCSNISENEQLEYKIHSYSCGNKVLWEYIGKLWVGHISHCPVCKLRGELVQIYRNKMPFYHNDDDISELPLDDFFISSQFHTVSRLFRTLQIANTNFQFGCFWIYVKKDINVDVNKSSKLISFLIGWEFAKDSSFEKYNVIPDLSIYPMKALPSQWPDQFKGERKTDTNLPNWFFFQPKHQFQGKILQFLPPSQIYPPFSPLTILSKTLEEEKLILGVSFP